MRAQRSHLRRRAARAALALLLGVAVLEASLRIVAATSSGRFASLLRQWDPDATLDLLGDACFRPWPGMVVRYPNDTAAHENEIGFRGPVVSVPKPPGTYRVVLLGGSTSHGCLVNDDETIDAHLRRALRVPDRNVEVVNLGFDALDALCEQERLAAEGVALEPDAVIVHTGINDTDALRFPDLPRNAPERGVRAAVRASQEATRRERGPWRMAKHLLFTARLPGVLRNLRLHAEPLPGPPEPEPRALDAFERTVRGTIALSPPGSVVLLSTPPSGMLVPGVPIAAQPIVDLETSQRYRDRLDERLRRIADDASATGRDVRYVPHTLPDEVFLDDCHVDGTGNRLLAEDFARALADAPHPR